MRPVTIEIEWGIGYMEGDEPSKSSYTFGSKVLADYFMMGVEEASGWLDHKVVFDGRYETRPEEEPGFKLTGE